MIDTRTFLPLLCILFTQSQAFAPTTMQRSAMLARSSASSSALFAIEDALIIVNGMPGPMATAAAEACLRKGLNLAPTAMTGPEIPPMTITVYDKISKRSADVKLIPATEIEEIKSSFAGLRETTKTLLAIDFTHPSAVNSNARFYVEQKLPFVMGTTGGDRDQLLKDVQNHFCVIAPNMGKQIVALQTALTDLSTKYPGAFDGYKLAVIESHQKTKADTSGTAKDVIQSLKKLSNDHDFTTENIEMIRDDAKAVEFGVPEDSLKGHAFHTYILTSPDGTVQFQLKHNVAGRTIYAEGTADAAKFLAKKLETEPTPRVFSMMDVLAEGALE